MASAVLIVPILIAGLLLSGAVVLAILTCSNPRLMMVPRGRRAASDSEKGNGDVAPAGEESAAAGDSTDGADAIEGEAGEEEAAA